MVRSHHHPDLQHGRARLGVFPGVGSDVGIIGGKANSCVDHRFSDGRIKVTGHGAIFIDY